MDYDIRLGDYCLQALESVVVKRSVENFADTAVLTLPGMQYNGTLKVEEWLHEGDPIEVRFGYDARLHRDGLPLEFRGYIRRIVADDSAVRIECEDEIYGFRRDLGNAALENVDVKQLLEHVAGELGGYEVACDYDFRYDRFTIYQATGFDVLRKVQQDTGANIYLRDRTLHVHPQYMQTGERVRYDFARNIEKSDLTYRETGRRPVSVTVEGTDAQGRYLSAVRGEQGGDRITLRVPGVSDRTALERRADEALSRESYAGYEGNFTGWLLPAIVPGDVAELRDAACEARNGAYYVTAVETTFAATGGSRKITIGKKVE